MAFHIGSKVRNAPDQVLSNNTLSGTVSLVMVKINNHDTVGLPFTDQPFSNHLQAVDCAEGETS